jgi:predicted lipoprotein
MGVWGFRLAVVVTACVVLYFVPLVRVTAIDSQAAEGVFDPAQFAATFWEERLIPAAADTHSAAQVVAALQEDIAAADKAYGVRVGVGRSFYLFVQGVGVVQGVEGPGVTLVLDGGDGNSIVRLHDRKVFGATIRDATGLLKGNEAPSSREYNLIASELDRLAETNAIAKLAKVAPGDRLRFAGCAKVASLTGFKPPLEVIPVLVEAAE